MIIPLAHENLHGRRWPWVSIAIIALCTAVFLFTHNTIDEQNLEAGKIQAHILIVSAYYPDTPMTPEAAELVQTFKAEHSDVYRQLQSPDRTDFFDAWDMRIHSTTDYEPDDAKKDMADLGAQLTEERARSITWNYAFHSVHLLPRTYITATFLHGSWLHLIFNMWFLWLAGTALEDLWGRIVYPIFFLVAGVVALAVHGAIYSHSLAATLGASGAIAGLMGAFLARFPTSKIRMGWIFMFALLRAKLPTFSIPAYIVLPLWLFTQLFWGVISKTTGAEMGIAYWAHIGGFAFGAGGAYLLRATGIERFADQAIEAKVSWAADPLIVRASDCLEAGKVDDAIIALRQLVSQNPDSLDGWDLMEKAQTRKGDLEGEKEALSALCRLHIIHGELDAAATEYTALQNLGGVELPRGAWVEICRYLEAQQRWHDAAEGYEKIAAANPTQRAGVAALVAAGRISLEHLDEPERAARLFAAAQASPVPHTHLDAEIQNGLTKSAALASAANLSQSEAYFSPTGPRGS